MQVQNYRIPQLFVHFSEAYRERSYTGYWRHIPRPSWAHKTHPKCKGTLKHLCPTLDLAGAYSAAQGIADRTVLDSIDSKLGYNKNTYHFQRIVVNLAEVVFSAKDIREQQAVIPIICILESAAFDAEVVPKNVADCDDLCPQGM